MHTWTMRVKGHTQIFSEQNEDKTSALCLVLSKTHPAQRVTLHNILAYFFMGDVVH